MINMNTVNKIIQNSRTSLMHSHFVESSLENIVLFTIINVVKDHRNKKWLLKLMISLENFTKKLDV